MDNLDDEVLEAPSIEVLRNGMSNFVGQCIQLMPFEGKDRNALVAAMFIEEALKVSQIEENAPCDLKVLQPLFKAMKVVVEQQIKEISKNPTNEKKQVALDFAEIILLIDKYFLLK